MDIHLKVKDHIPQTDATATSRGRTRGSVTMDTRGLTAIHYPPSRYPNSDHAYPKHPLSAYRTLSRHARMQFLRALPCPQFQVLIRTDAIAIQETQRREIMQIGVIMERADKTGSTRESCPKQRPNTDPTAMTVGTSPRASPTFRMTRTGTRFCLPASRILIRTSVP